MFSLIKMWSKIITTGLRSHVSTISFYIEPENLEKLEWVFQFLTFAWVFSSTSRRWATCRLRWTSVISSLNTWQFSLIFSRIRTSNGLRSKQTQVAPLSFLKGTVGRDIFHFYPQGDFNFNLLFALSGVQLQKSWKISTTFMIHL